MTLHLLIFSCDISAAVQLKQCSARLFCLQSTTLFSLSWISSPVSGLTFSFFPIFAQIWFLGWYGTLAPCIGKTYICHHKKEGLVKLLGLFGQSLNIWTKPERIRTQCSASFLFRKGLWRLSKQIWMTEHQSFCVCICSKLDVHVNLHALYLYREKLILMSNTFLPKLDSYTRPDWRQNPLRVRKASLCYRGVRWSSLKSPLSLSRSNSFQGIKKPSNPDLKPPNTFAIVVAGGLKVGQFVGQFVSKVCNGCLYPRIKIRRANALQICSLVVQFPSALRR